MMANNTVALSLSDAGQIQDGIEVLIEQWDAVAEYHKTGHIGVETCVHEASDAHEAESIAANYREIRDRIALQIWQIRSA